MIPSFRLNVNQEVKVLLRFHSNLKWEFETISVFPDRKRFSSCLLFNSTSQLHSHLRPSFISNLSLRQGRGGRGRTGAMSPKLIYQPYGARSRVLTEKKRASIKRHKIDQLGQILKNYLSVG